MLLLGVLLFGLVFIKHITAGNMKKHNCWFLRLLYIALLLSSLKLYYEEVNQLKKMT